MLWCVVIKNVSAYLSGYANEIRQQYSDTTDTTDKNINVEI